MWSLINEILYTMSSISDFDTSITLTVFMLSTSIYIISMSGIAMIKRKSNASSAHVCQLL